MILFFATTASANDFGTGHSMALRADQRCAEYGPDFTPVEGTDTCVRIGGRVRVDFGHGASPVNSGWANDSAAPAALRSGSSAYGSPSASQPVQARRLRLDAFGGPLGD